MMRWTPSTPAPPTPDIFEDVCRLEERKRELEKANALPHTLVASLQKEKWKQERKQMRNGNKERALTTRSSD